MRAVTFEACGELGVLGGEVLPEEPVEIGETRRFVKVRVGKTEVHRRSLRVRGGGAAPSKGRLAGAGSII